MLSAADNEFDVVSGVPFRTVMVGYINLCYRNLVNTLESSEDTIPWRSDGKGVVGKVCLRIQAAHHLLDEVTGRMNDVSAHSQTRKLLKLLLGCFFVCALVYTSFIVVLFIPIFWPISPAGDLSNLPQGETFAGTRFEFRYGHTTRVVEDPGNHLKVVYGEMPDSITVENGIRIIIYNEHKSVIKSQNDSMDVQDDDVSLRGYMGFSSDASHFVVDEDGYVNELQEQ